MFEMHVGDGLTIDSSTVQSPTVILGKAGQGKTVFIMLWALELIKNKQRGLLYDPFGDLARDIQDRTESEEVKQHTTFLTQEEFLSSQEAINGFVVVQGQTLEDGAAATRGVAQEVVRKAYTLLDEDAWLIIDQASDIADQELFSKYIGADMKTPRTLLCDQTLINYSRAQREELFSKAQQWVFFKVRNIDGRFLEENFASPTAKDIAAMKQYHFYYIGDGEPQYTTSRWPVEKI